MIPFFSEVYANASSSHLLGLTVNESVVNAHFQLADLLNAKPKEITFTSGATEAINLAIKGLVGFEKKHIVTVATEHKAVLDTCEYMKEQGFTVTYLPVKNNGLIDLLTLKNAIKEDTLIVIVMLANNEIGVLQPIKEISTIAHSKEALFMTDATQAVGKIAIDVKEMGIEIGRAHV